MKKVWTYWTKYDTGIVLGLILGAVTTTLFNGLYTLMIVGFWMLLTLMVILYNINEENFK